MFSTISGQYFSGHLATVATVPIVVDPNLPLPNNLIVFYDMANSLSYTSGSTSVVSLTNIKNTASINGSNPYSDTAPKNMTSIEPASVKLDASTTATLDVGNTRTYSFWFKYTNTDTGVIRATSLFTQYDTASPLNYFRLGVYSISNQGGTLLADFGVSVPGGSSGALSIGQNAGSSITIGSWYMASVVINYSNPSYMVISFYINGVLQSTGSSQSLALQYNPTGSTQTTEITMTSEVQPLWSKFMMWNAGLNATQVAQLYNYQRVYYGAPEIPVAMPDPSRLILDYNIAQSGSQNPIPNVGSGGTANLTTSITPTFQTTTAPVWATNSSLGVDSSVVSPSSVRLNTSAYRTMSIWFYIAANPATSSTDIITNNNTVTNWDGVYIQLFGGGTIHFTTNGGSIFRSYDHNSMPLNKWTLITMVYIVSATLPVYCYVDGALVGQFIHGNDSVDALAEHKVRVNACSGYGGKWSEVKLWDVGLSAEQVMYEFTSRQSYYGA